ncbi:hypothetical protein L9F63_006247 [Diploptera punctata]|uniref:methylated diphthine methylhydrolase n=1 Tax=Diploptera punctata TaxID=6984 RepID=A0AAD7ZAM9_DIPPU|nr:hypothetical protein L9F63_006247 [Diploptera punctata]
METLHQWDTIYSADSVEWCPIAPHQNIFVCGTYQLAEHESQQDAYKRLGRLYLFKFNITEDLKLVQTIDMPAILDMKWCQRIVNGNILLAIANATGSIDIFKLDSDECSLSLLCSGSVAETNVETLALSLDWSEGRENPVCNPSIVVSNSKGCIALLKLDGTSLVLSEHWKAHDFEAWIAAFDYWNTCIVYSGGDDCKLKVNDTRVGSHIQSCTHDAGVTSLHTNVMREHVLASGSYDEQLRIWDTRSMKRAVNVIRLTGGVWRLKWDPHKWEHLLASCMHGGFCIVNTSDESPKIVAQYEEHKSLAYGSDWCHLKGEQRFIATCSFYDHKLCLSAIKNNCLD